MTGATLPIAVPLAAIADLCRRYRVRELSLFGSVLRDDFGPESDVDVLVEFEPGARVTFITLGEMARELETLFGRKVDLGLKSALKPLIRQAVLDSARVVFAA